ncbi:MAG: amidohydrolase family protein [Kordiimonas sp.]
MRKGIAGYIRTFLLVSMLMHGEVATALDNSAPSNTKQTQAAWQCKSSPLIVQNIKVWNGEQFLENQDIYVKGGKIAEIRNNKNSAYDRNIRTINGKGKIALPGFIDSHAHFDAVAAAKELQTELDVQTEIFPITMRQTIASGVTFARTHLAALKDIKVMEELAADNCFPSPRLSLAGPGLLGGAPNVNGRLMRGFSSISDMEHKIREAAELNTEWLAVHGIAKFSKEELIVLTQLTEQYGLKLLADADSFEALQTTVNSSAISGEYINRTAEPSFPDSILAAIAKRNNPYYSVAPIGYYYRAQHYVDQPTPVIAASSLQFIDETVTARMKTSHSATYRDNRYIKQMVIAHPTLKQKFWELRRAGAKQVIGTDSGSLGQFHIDAIWWELETWRNLGVPSNEIIDAATALPAQMLDQPDIGKLKEGYLADIILYDSTDFTGSLQKDLLSTVIKGGVIYVEKGEWVGPNRDQTIMAISKAKLMN